ncbi:MAG TPA: hypothetical protein VI814_05450 [Candidatus Limnocylindria bacterium]
MVASFLLLGDTRQAFAKADCLQTNPAADVAVTQTITPSGTDLLKQITLTNFGPCNVPDVVFLDTLPTGSTVDTSAANPIVTNPSSWSCKFGSNVAPVQVTCSTTSTMGVPGTTNISILITPPSSGSWTDLAQALVGGGSTPGAGCADGKSSTTCDPATANNSNWTGALTPGGSIEACADASNGCAQKLNILANTGSGSVVIRNLSDARTTCAAITGFPSCFGTVVAVDAPSLTSTVKTLTVSAALTTQSYGNVNVIRSATADGTGTWSRVPGCNNSSGLPCVVSKSKFKDAAGNTFYQFQVQTADDDSWGFE